ncbi:helix-turn-helix domain-containing protein [Leptolyngbya ohadii]|uniref:helix-turn-helix domain-containing protein n=1 Tax=Leptolyngbya ohadii TaxID=1962290 RepID=UPI000B599AAB|nr:AraC family transcriptional regulator [Leptolyngbya ohadii]
MAAKLSIDFAQEQEQGYERVFARRPLLTNLSLSWNGIYFAYDYMPPGETPEVSAKQHCIAIFANPSAIRAERRLDGKFRQEDVQEGDMVITPADVSCATRWHGSGGVILLGVEPSRFAQAGYEFLDPDRVELAPRFATSDPLTYQLGRSIKQAIEQDAVGNCLYAETLANTLIVHVLQHYATRPLRLQDRIDRLPHAQLQQVIDYIYAHLDQNLSLAQLAVVAGMSPHYFAQRFKQSMGMSPHQFVIRCRVERAKQLLQQGRSIAETALLVGFVDQSHLNRHFKRWFGITPKMLR